MAARRKSVTNKVGNLNPEEVEQFVSLTTKPYYEQAKWFMNAFWHDTFRNNPEERESVWLRAHKFVDLDPKRETGCQMDEALSHKFLESLGETLTVLELRDKLRKIDIDMNGMMAISEYLLFKYEKGSELKQFVHPQADPSEMKRAQEAVEGAQKAQQEMQSKLAEQKQKLQEQEQSLRASKAAAEAAKVKLQEQSERLEESKRSAALAHHKLADARVKADAQQKALDEVKAAEAEAKRTLHDLEAQEKKHQDQISDLEHRSTTGGAVTKGRAAAELAQLRAVDPLPLRVAKTNQGAAVRRVERAAAAAQEAKEAADKAQREAEQAKIDADQAERQAEEATAAAEQAKRAADKAAEDAQAAKLAAEEAKAQAEEAAAAADRMFDEALHVLEEAKKRAVNEGSVWWLEREMEEIRKYRPGYKGKVKPIA